MYSIAMLIDTHAHIHVKDFDSDRDQVIARALSANVMMINVGFDLEGIRQSAVLAKNNKSIYWAAGFHPHSAQSASDENINVIVDLAQKEEGKKLVAIGETGLDFFRNPCPRDEQISGFVKQLRLAKKLNLPVILHCRDAFEDTFRILNEEKIERAVFHCFSDTLKEAKQCWEKGYFTSFTGICTYPKAENVREIVANAPLDMIMIETDCPYLAPQSVRGKRNEPAFVREIFNKIAEIRKADLSDLESIIFKNSVNFFKLD